MTVIIADDSTVQNSITEAMLWHFPELTLIRVYTDGLEALNGVRALKPDLAILDYIMPNRTGREVILEMRREGLTSTKFIMATSMGQKAAAHSLDVPVLVKPFSPALMRIALHQVGIDGIRR